MKYVPVLSMNRGLIFEPRTFYVLIMACLLSGDMFLSFISGGRPTQVTESVQRESGCVFAILTMIETIVYLQSKVQEPE